jgi:MFS family permease
LCFAAAGFIGTLFLIPLFLQVVRGATPLEAGLTTFPEALGVVTSTQLVARLYPRVGPSRLMTGGLVGMATAIVLLGIFAPSGDPWLLRFLMFLVGAGMAYVFLPNQAAGLATISRAQTGRATTITNVNRQLGAAIGVAALSTVLGAAGVGAGTDSQPYRVALFVAAVFALVGAAAATRVPDSEAAETMRPRPTKKASSTAQVAQVATTVSE